MGCVDVRGQFVEVTSLLVGPLGVQLNMCHPRVCPGVLEEIQIDPVMETLLGTNGMRRWDGLVSGCGSHPCPWGFFTET